MESSDLAALDLLLSPPYLCWFSRDECPLPVLVWGERSPPAWLPAGLGARAALTAGAAAACAGVALLLWRLRPGDGGSVVENKELESREVPSTAVRTSPHRVTIIPSPHHTPHHLTSPPATHLPPLSPQRVTITPSPHSPPHLTPPPGTHYEVEIEGQEISFFDENDSDDEPTSPAPPTSARRGTAEFNLSFTSTTREGEGEGEGEHALVSEDPEEGESESEQVVVSQTVLTILH